RGLHPGIGKEALRFKATEERGLRVFRRIRTVGRRVDSGGRQRWWKGSLKRSPKDRVQGKPEDFAPGDCFFPRPSKAKTAQGGRDLQAVIKPVPHHQVAALSG